MFASPDELPCFEWGLLEGYTAPRFRMEDPFGVQGTKFSLEHDFGCGAIDMKPSISGRRMRSCMPIQEPKE